MEGRRFRRVAQAATVAMLLAVWLSPLSGRLSAQASGAASGSPSQPNAAQQDLAKQIEALRAQVAQLQTALDQQRQAAQTAPMAASPAQGGMPMGQMGQMRQQMMGQMGKMPQSGPAAATGCCMGMDMHKGEMGMPPDGMKMPDRMMMDDMGRMSGMSSGASMAPMSPASTTTPSAGMNMGSNTTMTMPSASRSMSSLPGVPGTSHLYHVGATGFFLDQPQLTLTAQQQTALNTIKERALLERANAERRIEQGEQELWALTGTDQPDAAKIQAKAREIEQLRTSQRLAFIQAVGEATKVLTPEQRTQVLGMAGMPAK